MEKFIVTYKEANNRLDKALSLFKSDLSRSYIAKLIDEGKVLVNDKKEKSSFKVKENDVISLLDIENKTAEINKEDIPLDVVYEDDDIMIINKVQGMVVHPANGHYSGTLVNALMYQADSLSTINGVVRPGIVHRIDKDTSGLICIAKNDNAHHFLSDQLKDHTMAREYMALVRGVIKENSGTIDMPIGRDKNPFLRHAPGQGPHRAQGRRRGGRSRRGWRIQGARRRSRCPAAGNRRLDEVR